MISGLREETGRVIEIALGATNLVRWSWFETSKGCPILAPSLIDGREFSPNAASEEKSDENPAVNAAVISLLIDEHVILTASGKFNVNFACEGRGAKDHSTPYIRRMSWERALTVQVYRVVSFIRGTNKASPSSRAG